MPRWRQQRAETLQKILRGARKASGDYNNAIRGSKFVVVVDFRAVAGLRLRRVEVLLNTRFLVAVRTFPTAYNS